MWDRRDRSGYVGFEVRGSILSDCESITASYEFRHITGAPERTSSRIRRWIRGDIEGDIRSFRPAKPANRLPFI
jgi:hypothetical protein